MKLTEEQAERLVEEYADLLLRTAYSWTGNLADAQDACQTALLKLIAADRRFDGPEGQKAWLLRVTINECKSLNRPAWRRHRADLEEAALPGPWIVPESLIDTAAGFPITSLPGLPVHPDQDGARHHIIHAVPLKPDDLPVRRHM